MNIDITPNWEIRYSEYVGDLYLFDKIIYNKDRQELFSEKKNNMTLTYDAKSNKLLMVEISSAKNIVPNIEKKDKIYIINKVKECILK